MTVRIDMGLTASGTTATMDLEELLATRLLVQGNSGSGKSHLLRRLVEQSAPVVQQAIIDPEGDFVTLADLFGHVVVEASSHTEAALQQIGARVRQHRISVVLNLENLDAEMQMRHAAAFLGGMFDVDRDFWFPVLVVVDEAQMFAPAAAGEVSDEARKASLGAMTNLMCRGRKRGLAGVIATQRLAKLAKNVAAEASNFLMGRTFLDIDMARAADLLGMERKQAEMFRDLERGRFIALGPAMCRRPLPIRIGDVQTSARAVAPKLMPLPEMGENARDLIMKPGENEVPRYNARRPTPASTAEILAQLAARPKPAAPPPPSDLPAMDESGAIDMTAAAPATPAPRPAAPRPVTPAEKGSYDAVLQEIMSDPEAVYRSVSVLYQDFVVRCRSHGLNGRMLDLGTFRRKLALARAGAAARPESGDAAADGEWEKAVAIVGELPEDAHGVFLLLARAALEQAPCPSDARIARAMGSRSARRARSQLGYIEQRGLIACAEMMDGSRVIAIPPLEWETAPGDPNAPDDEEYGEAV
ncbi:MAG TPA: ATP-binding protein [Candidatus Sulfotelmatobacter sp.]|jgi:hypothetical protein|nr:ATP-binding protein [Candidatus Sulfotelmatobacter sp.]